VATQRKKYIEILVNKRIFTNDEVEKVIEYLLMNDKNTMVETTSS
jgi:hypothetical protein